MSQSLEGLDSLCQNSELNFNSLDRVKQIIGRVSLTLGLSIGLVGLSISPEIDEPSAAFAVSDTYPDDNAPCISDGPNKGKTSGTGYWCNNYDWGYGSSSNSGRGYGYRNCTDWVAWRIDELDIGNVPRGWGNAKNWDDAAQAAGFAVDTTPEPGDIAVWNDGSYGHVEVVESVNNNGSVNTSGYNQSGNGTFGVQYGVQADRYIDLNGSNSSGGSGGDGDESDSPATDLAWWQGNVIFTMPGPNFSTTSYTDGIQTPDWAGVMDYNNDGLDDLVIYRKSDGTIRVIEKNSSGGWTPRSDNPVRGPGFGAPAWAGVGDFDGDGKDDDLAWWTAGGKVHKLVWDNFNTASYIDGIQPPDWADVMDYNNDGRDDIVFYRKSNGTIRLLINDRAGGWHGYANNPVRGPGFGAPAAAEVGDLDGDGRDDDIGWWAASGNVHKLIGPNFNTASYTSGIQPPDWAALSDYNNDGRDDFLFYRKSSGVIGVLNNRSGGGWVSDSQNPIRGPGIAMPDWAVVGRFSKD